MGIERPTLAAMRQSIVDGAPEAAAALAREGLRIGIAAIDAIQQGYVPGMHAVGEEFAQRRLFLPDMMAAAEAMRAAMEVLEPALLRMGAERPVAGVVLLGTVQGDIHEIGKTLVGTLLTAHGFRVHDLGVDVPVERFVAKVSELNPDIVGLSALLTTTMKQQRTVIEALAREGLRTKLRVLVGGAPATRRWAEEIGADGWGKDAVSAVTLAQSLMDSRPRVPFPKT
ncbi:MAG TPA: cobalamin-dependent protein [Terriglobales bacterium]|nr:cobalamin-dependent protein [Terriglobales bacterium]